MEKEKNGTERRELLLSLLKNTEKPLSGSELGKKTGVSRQVVVQDIALLRTQGYDIVSTVYGYIVQNSLPDTKRVVKVCHTNAQIEEELQTIVDLGGCVQDIMVNHRVYGKVTAPLSIKNRRDIQKFLEDLRTGKSTPLSEVTAGYHFHTITAESVEVLDEIEEALRAKGFLAELTPYEQMN